MNNNQEVANSKHTIKSLRMAGFRTRVIHERFVYDNYINGVDLLPLYVIKEHNLQSEILNYGGNTVIEITTPDGKYDITGEAKCSKKDPYCKKYGVNVALGRAVSELVKLGYLT